MIRRASSEADIEILWQARREASAGFERRRHQQLVRGHNRASISRFAEAVEGAARIAEKHDLTIIQFGHAGDGNLHPVIMFPPPRMIPRRRRVQAAATDIHRLAVSLGGTLTGEHGIGLAKARFLDLEHDRVAWR